MNALNNDVSLFVSEFGTTEYTGNGIIDTIEVKKCFDFMSKHKISWCNWLIGNKNETSAALKQGANAKGDWIKNGITFSREIVKKKIGLYNQNILLSE